MLGISKNTVPQNSSNYKFAKLTIILSLIIIISLKSAETYPRNLHRNISYLSNFSETNICTQFQTKAWKKLFACAIKSYMKCTKKILN